jgi:type 1 glutamine amidotransferase
MPVLITGSSHVRRLQDYEEARHALKNVAIDNINVEFQGIGGGRVMDSVHTSQINLKIQSSQPDHVVLHIGGHDLDVTQVNEQYCVELEFKLVLLAETFISRHRLQSLIICELFVNYH